MKQIADLNGLQEVIRELVNSWDMNKLLSKEDEADAEQNGSSERAKRVSRKKQNKQKRAPQARARGTIKDSSDLK